MEFSLPWLKELANQIALERCKATEKHWKRTEVCMWICSTSGNPMARLGDEVETLVVNTAQYF